MSFKRNWKRNIDVSWFGRGKEVYAILLTLCVLTMPGANEAADGHRSDSTEVHLVVGYSAQVFVDVDSEEARSVAQVWSDQILKRKFTDGVSKSVVLQDVSSLERSFREKEIDLAAVVSDEYLYLKDRVPVEPVFVTANSYGPYHQIVLIVRRDQGIRQLQDLRGRDLTVSQDRSRTIHMTWIETLLMENGFRRAEDFFAVINEARKPSQAILPVFFKQTDACVTTLQAFNVVCELNPQVAKDLMILHQSADLAGGVIVFRPDYNESHKERLIEVLGTLHIDPQGRQLLRLFHLNKLLPFKDEYLETVGALVRRHEALKVGGGSGNS